MNHYLFLFGQINISSQTTITYTLTAKGSYWEWGSSYYPLSSDSDWEEAEVAITGSTTTEPSSSCTGDEWPGFYFSWGPLTCLPVDFIAYGFYKVTNSHNNDYFYIDLRDCKYAGSVYGPCGNYTPDFHIRYNDSENRFRWKRSGDWNLISTGEVLNVWDICNNGTAPTTSYFEDFWENALVATNNGNNKPRIVWGPYPNPGSLPGTITGYKIYRCAGHAPGQPGTFGYLTTVDNDVFEYTDLSATIGGDYNANSYYVKAVYEDPWESSGETSATNTVEVRLQIPQKIKLSNNVIAINDFSLEQNYPNPFNPITVINYSIPEDSKVQIKVYDMLGIEVAELVNENKATGNYEVTFEALNLSSGVYIYRITALNGERILFTRSKQMLLMK